MAGRPKIYDETTILDKAVEVFWEKGYTNATADDLLLAMGIGKGSFYFAFKGGKEELFRKSMERVVELNFNAIRESLATCENPVQFIRDFFLSLAGNDSPVGNKGCYFGNALIQVSADDSGLKMIAAKYLHLLEEIFTEAIQKSKDLGLLQTNEPAGALGTYLVNLWNGLNVTRRMEPDQRKLAELVRMNLNILN
ncbi:TetR family transcriptional regulator [Dyadobacter endophyticus]|uniref:TetR family transcriptional regulator n=1 Tax=Dyadobacter endophyticus TaxID=1749036 RepID=A0ABQ1YQR1_9BACT|nr:TetR/AcrR family transcriptional regulator [Dyadobacter endophyticus]GGH35161.1 TetR family transcriptional regulator [Dyadobacter endophyticus]